MKKINATCLILILMISVAKAQLTLPYFTGFDTPLEKAGWQEFRTGFISNYNWNNTGQLSHDYNVGGNPTDTVIDWYVSPPLKYTGAGKMIFKIRIGGFSQATPDNLELWITTKNPNPASGNYTKIANLSYMQPKNTWIDTTIDINTISDSVYLAFKYKAIGAAWWTPNIDSITFKTNFPSAINEVKGFENSIFPNPVLTTLNISNKDATEICIFNLSGKMVLCSKDKNLNAINVSSLSIGTYFYKLYNNKTQIVSSKFSKQ